MDSLVAVCLPLFCLQKVKNWPSKSTVQKVLSLNFNTVRHSKGTVEAKGTEEYWQKYWLFCWDSNV